MIQRENGTKALSVGVIGSGMISDIYISNMMNRFDNLEVRCIASRHMENAQKKALKYGLPACTTEEMLADPDIDMVVVLTPAGSHAELIKQALLAGKHVYTEKTITDSTETAKELLRLADEKGLYLGSAPDTFLGSALQTARKAIDDGLIGEVTSFVASANRDNNILLTYFPFLREPGAGIGMDYGIYYLTAVISLLGPVKKTAAFVKAPFLKHKNINPQSPDFGKDMDTPNESEISAILEMESGITGTFHLNADSIISDLAKFYIYGTKGVLSLTDPNAFGGNVEIIETKIKEGSPWPEVTSRILPAANPYSDNSRGIGPSEMAAAILSGRKNRAGKEMAYHALEVLEAMLESGKDARCREISSSCERPEPFKGECSE